MKSIIASAILVLIAAGCSTTNSLIRLAPDYSELPAENLRSLASTIEEAVTEGDEAPTLATAGEIEVETPAMRQAIRTRAIRYPLLSEMLDAGFAFEGDNGLIAIRRNSAYKKATTSRQRDREAMLVMSENSNRWAIYEGLVEANEWPPRSLSAVQETFFKARVPLLKPGQQHAPAE